MNQRQRTVMIVLGVLAMTTPLGLAGETTVTVDVDAGDSFILAFIINGTITEGFLTGPMAKSRSANPYFFTGRWLDPLDLDDNDTPTDFTDDFLQLPIYYFRARTYDPVYMRFLQRDPLGYADGMGLYQYVMGMPSFLADPTGLKIWTKDYGTFGLAVH